MNGVNLALREAPGIKLWMVEPRSGFRLSWFFPIDPSKVTLEPFINICFRPRVLPCPYLSQLVSSVLRILLSLPVHKYLIFAFQVCFAVCNIRTQHHISETLFRKLEISFAILSRNLISNPRGPCWTDIINSLKDRQYPDSVTSCLRARAGHTLLF